MNLVKSIEFVFFIIIFTIISIIIPFILIVPGHPLLGILFLEIIIMIIAFDLSELTSIIFLGELDLQKLNHLDKYPDVAILFLVCDDLVCHALANLNKYNYPKAKVYILDDSNDIKTKYLIDRTGFIIIRRLSNKGYKAGNLNNWLQKYGSLYKYFIILDSDSVIPEDFIESMVMYAEHPANLQVAIFNSLPMCWNTHLRFPRLLSTLTPMRNWIRMRLANRSSGIFSSGHNNLHRTQAINKVGGFDEEFIAEDIAITLKLYRAGYTSKLVKLIGYETEPEHIFSYVKRLNRWAKQTVQIQRANWQGIDLSLRFQMFKLNWTYISFFLYLIWSVFAAWGATSSLEDVEILLSAIFRNDSQLIVIIRHFIVAMALPLMIPLLRIPLLIKLDISLREYAESYLLLLLIGLYTMIAACWSQIGAAASSTLYFTVTDKNSCPVTLKSIIFYHWHLIPFWFFLVLGFSQNPVSLFLLAPWVLLLMFSPLLIYLFHNSPHPEGGVTNETN